MLNISIKVAAQSSNTFYTSLFSYKFLIGSVSITIMMIFYYNVLRFNLSQALMLMASSSIIFGTLFDKFYNKASLTNIDLFILILILATYVYKYTSKISASQVG